MAEHPLAAILTDARRRYGWTLREVEQATGIPNAHISQLETGKIASPAIVVLVKLAKVYALPLRRLLEAAGQGADWALVTEVSEAEIRADERARIAQLAEKVDAFYDAPCPDGVADCVHQDSPFADLIRKGPPDPERAEREPPP